MILNKYLAHILSHDELLFVTGGLGLAIEGPSKAEIQCKDNKDGTATITYTPVAPGDYKIIIKFAGHLIPGAPYTARITPARKGLTFQLRKSFTFLNLSLGHTLSAGHTLYRTPSV